VSDTHAFKFLAPDGKRRSMDALDSNGIIKLAGEIPSKRSARFLEWFTYSDNTVDGQSKKKAYDFFESGLIDDVEVGTTKGLQQIHAYIFGGLYDFAGQVRTQNISKGGFKFAQALYLGNTLKQIDKMPEITFDDIADKYVEMNVAHPFMEGNGRSTRMWLDVIFKKRLDKCVDWSRINKKDYLNAMIRSNADSTEIKALLRCALTDEVNSREMFMKGIDYSYYYEETTDIDGEEDL